jgi:dGTPase
MQRKKAKSSHLATNNSGSDVIQHGSEVLDKEAILEWHRSLITHARYKGISTVAGRSVAEEATSDRARVIYSSAFRRLQQKTQVFTLSKDAAVRSRLSHSLEVANTGRWIAQKVVDQLLRLGLEPAYCSAIVTLVETGCLAHDIGNPPFGHFGEAAIREWFESNWEKVAGVRAKDPKLRELVKDFLQFDGNPQGTRILLRLHGRTREEREKYGMDLTFSQVLTALKYPRGPNDDNYKWKKAGFFESERPKIDKAWKELAFAKQQRFPLAYLVEAADDISYCISDMEDGIDQGMFTPFQLFDEILKNWNPKNDLQDIYSDVKNARDKIRRNEILKTRDPGLPRDLFFKFKTDFGGVMISKAASLYADGSAEDIRNGTRTDLFDCKTGEDAKNLLEVLKKIARTYLYPTDKVERPFLAGLQIVHGIMDAFGRLLRLTREQFTLLKKAWHSGNRKEIIKQNLDTLLPLLDLLPLHYLEVYSYGVNFGDKKNDETQLMAKNWGKDNWEWFCRAHLIVDYLSGMTDSFAYRTYQVISGASLE